jgi:hypothetical protein
MLKALFDDEAGDITAYETAEMERRLIALERRIAQDAGEAE